MKLRNNSDEFLNLLKENKGMILRSFSQGVVNLDPIVGECRYPTWSVAEDIFRKEVVCNPNVIRLSEKIFIKENLEKSGFLMEFNHFHMGTNSVIYLSLNLITKSEDVYSLNMSLSYFKSLKELFPKAYAEIRKKVKEGVKSSILDSLINLEEQYDSTLGLIKSFDDFKLTFDESKDYLNNMKAVIKKSEDFLCFLKGFREDAYERLTPEEKLRFEVEEDDE